MGFIITLAHQKGGTGKTTVCTNLAYELGRRVGHDQVLVVDADPQASIIHWSDRRNPETYPLPFDLIGLPSTNVHTTVWQKYRHKYAYILIDTPARVTDIPRSCIYAADLVLIVTRAATYDIDAVKDTVQLIDEAKIYRKEIQAVFVVNDKDQRTKHSYEAVLPEITNLGLPICTTIINTRDIFVSCLNKGLTIFEYLKDDNAHNQIITLADEILTYETDSKTLKRH